MRVMRRDLYIDEDFQLIAANHGHEPRGIASTGVQDRGRKTQQLV